MIWTLARGHIGQVGQDDTIRFRNQRRMLPLFARTVAGGIAFVLRATILITGI
jgi:hypothetical protein